MLPYFCFTFLKKDFDIMKRHSVNKRSSVRKFGKQAGRTKAINNRTGLARGGIRL